MRRSLRLCGLGTGFLLAALTTPTAAWAQEPVKVFAAGSLVAPLREVIAASGLPPPAVALPIFGPAGLLRQRLGTGENGDLFLSANLAHPRSLQASGRALQVVPFARNSLCLLSRKSLGTSAESVLDRLLDPDLRLATSTPGADPGGDYAFAVFDKADAVRAGSRRVLEGKALKLMGSPNAMTPIDGKSVPASIFAADKADVLLYYCSSTSDAVRELPGLVSSHLPEPLEVTVVYGMAILSDKPDALRLALFLLSDPGQAILVRNGLMPVLSGE